MLAVHPTDVARAHASVTRSTTGAQRQIASPKLDPVRMVLAFFLRPFGLERDHVALCENSVSARRWSLSARLKSDVEQDVKSELSGSITG
jgi:hypothetical protein